MSIEPVAAPWRFEDWPQRLDAWVERVRARPFAWGEWDCVTCAASAVQEITGVSPLGGLAWSGAIGAARQLEADGGLEAAVTARLGEPIAAAYAQRGDLVMILHPGETPGAPDAEPPHREILAVCLADVAAAPGPNGLEFISMLCALRAWCVGR